MELKYSEMRCHDIIENSLRPLLNDEKYEELVKKWGEIVSDSTYVPIKERKNFMPSLAQKLLWKVQEWVKWIVSRILLFAITILVLQMTLPVINHVSRLPLVWKIMSFMIFFYLCILSVFIPWLFIFLICGKFLGNMTKKWIILPYIFLWIYYLFLAWTILVPENCEKPVFINQQLQQICSKRLGSIEHSYAKILSNTHQGKNSSYNDSSSSSYNYSSSSSDSSYDSDYSSDYSSSSFDWGGGSSNGGGYGD